MREHSRQKTIGGRRRRAPESGGKEGWMRRADSQKVPLGDGHRARLRKGYNNVSEGALADQKGKPRIGIGKDDPTRPEPAVRDGRGEVSATRETSLDMGRRPMNKFSIERDHRSASMGGNISAIKNYLSWTRRWM